MVEEHFSKDYSLIECENMESRRPSEGRNVEAESIWRKPRVGTVKPAVRVLPFGEVLSKLSSIGCRLLRECNRDNVFDMPKWTVDIARLNWLCGRTWGVPNAWYPPNGFRTLKKEHAYA